ncbi:MAG: hypothetical protein R6U04_08760, partial [Bacteroidales bacterium]
INTTASFYDFTVINGDVSLQTPLTVLNDLTLQDNQSLTMNDYGLEIGRDFNLNNGATYDHGNNTTYFTGEKNSNIYIEDNSTQPGLTFKGLTIEKDNQSARVYFNSPRTEKDTILSMDSLLTLERGILDYTDFVFEMQGDSIINEGTLGTDTSKGRLLLNGDNQQTLISSTIENTAFGHVELNNTQGAELDGDVFMKELTLKNGTLDIGNNRLTIDRNNINGSDLNTDNPSGMINMSGDHSAKGLRLNMAGEYNSDSSIIYPIASTNGYSQAVIEIPGDKEINEGYLTVIPVNEPHPAYKEGGGQSCDNLDYYWKTIVSSGLKNISDIDYKFYNPLGDPGGGAKNMYILKGQSEWVEMGNYSNPLLYTDIGFATGDFTAGKNSCYNSVCTFYSDSPGSWTDENTWNPEPNTNSNEPRARDFVVIQNPDSVYIDETDNGRNAASLTIYNGGILDLNTSNNHNFTRISGGGKFRTSTPDIPTDDYGDFVNNDTAIFEYYGGPYALDDYQLTYPNLWITGDANSVKTLPNADLLVKRNLKIGDPVNTGVTLALSNNENGDVVIEDSVFISNGGRVLLPGDGTKRSVTVYNSIILNDKTDSVTVASGNSGEAHDLFVEDDIHLNNGQMVLNKENSPGVDLTFQGDSISELTSTSSDTVKLNKLIIDKNNADDTVYINTPLTIDTTEISLILKKGVLVLNHDDIDITLSAGKGDFEIHGNSSLILRQGATARITGDENGLILDSRLSLEDSSRLILEDTTFDHSHDNYIEYTSSGNAILEIHDDATLTVGSQVRRGLVNSSGVLKYRQTGGTVTAGKNAAPEGNRGVLEVLKDDSEFKHTGGELIVSRGQTDASVASVIIDEPGITDISDIATLQLGDSNTPTGDTIGLNSTVSLSNVLVSGNEPAAQLMINGLTLTGGLEVGNGNTTFNANDLNVTLAGDFINGGIYEPGTNTTKFNGAKQQVFGNTEFNNMVVSSTDTLLLSGSTMTNLTITDSLAINSAVLVDSANTITMEGSIHNSGTHVSTATEGGIKLAGDAAINMSGGGAFGNVELDNPEGVTLTNSATINDRLLLTEGVFRIKKYRLILNGNLTGSDFSNKKMIQTDGDAGNSGLRYTVPQISEAESFKDTIPIGSPMKYTPVDLDVSYNKSPGQVTFKPNDGPHTNIEAKDSVLQYYWKLESSNIDSISLNMVFHYEQSDVPTPYSSIEQDYIPAYLYELGWRKFSPSGVNNYENEIIFHDLDSPAGDFTAGHEDAIPDSVAVFNSVKNGDWNNSETWHREGEDSPGDNIPSDGPNGYVVNIEHSVYVPSEPKYFSIEPYKTSILSGGVLDLGNTYGHYLGEVTGEGTISLGLGKLPGGDYDEFFTCSGGALEYKGDGEYTISTKHDTLRKLIFSGTGVRMLPLNDLVICDSLIINGPTLNNSAYDNKITLLGDLARLDGIFDAGDASGAIVEFSGSSQQTISNSFIGENAFYNLKLDNSDGLLLTDSVDIDNRLNLTNGIIHTADTSVLYLSNTDEDVVSGAGSSDYIDGPLDKQIISNGSFEYPVGDQGKLGWVDVLEPSSTDRWQAQYYNQNPADAGYNPNNTDANLATVSQEEFWRVKGPDGAQSKVQIYWDDDSELDKIVDDYSNDLRIVEWNDTDNQWNDAGDLIDETDQTVETNNAQTLDEHPYTFGSTEYTSPTVELEAIQADICEGNTATLRFELTGEGPWELTYEHPASGSITVSDIGTTPYEVDTITTTGSYSVESLKDSSGVEAAADDLGDTVEITVSPVPAPEIIGDTSVCQNSTQIYYVDKDDNVDHYFDWTVIGGDIVSGSSDDETIQVEWQDYGDAIVEVTVGVVNTDGCESTTDTTVTVYETPVPDITANPNPLCYGDTVDLDANTTPSSEFSVFEYSWEPADTVDNASAKETFYVPFNPNAVSITKTFDVEVTNKQKSDCQDTDSVDVVIYRKPQTGNQYYVPSEFDQ